MHIGTIWVVDTNVFFSFGLFRKFCLPLWIWFKLQVSWQQQQKSESKLWIETIHLNLQRKKKKTIGKSTHLNQIRLKLTVTNVSKNFTFCHKSLFFKCILIFWFLIKFTFYVQDFPKNTKSRVNLKMKILKIQDFLSFSFISFFHFFLSFSFLLSMNGSGIWLIH